MVARFSGLHLGMGTMLFEPDWWEFLLDLARKEKYVEQVSSYLDDVEAAGYMEHPSVVSNVAAVRKEVRRTTRAMVMRVRFGKRR
jgi:hypothetical protein